MSKVHYVTCPSCSKRYYLDRLLHDLAVANPRQNLKCPFCKKVFEAQASIGKASPAGPAVATK